MFDSWAQLGLCFILGFTECVAQLMNFEDDLPYHNGNQPELYYNLFEPKVIYDEHQEYSAESSATEWEGHSIYTPRNPFPEDRHLEPQKSTTAVYHAVMTTGEMQGAAVNATSKTADRSDVVIGINTQWTTDSGSDSQTIITSGLDPILVLSIVIGVSVALILIVLLSMAVYCRLRDKWFANEPTLLTYVPTIDIRETGFLSNQGYDGLSESNTESNSLQGEDDVTEIKEIEEYHQVKVHDLVEESDSGKPSENRAGCGLDTYEDMGPLSDQPDYDSACSNHGNRVGGDFLSKFPQGNYEYCDPHLKDRFPRGKYENCCRLEQLSEEPSESQCGQRLSCRSERSQSPEDMEELSHMDRKLNEYINPLYSSSFSVSGPHNTPTVLPTGEDQHKSEPTNNLNKYNLTLETLDLSRDNSEYTPQTSPNATSVSDHHMYSTQSCPNSPLFDKQLPNFAMDDELINCVIKNHVRLRQLKSSIACYSETSILKAVKLNGVLRPLEKNVDNTWEMSTCF